MKKIFLAVIILIAAATVAAADTIYLRDGRTIHGTLLGFINGRFVVRVELRYSTPPSATAPDAAGPGVTPPPAGDTPRPAPPVRRLLRPRVPVAAGDAVIPAGAELAVDT